jgi:hypothetical protein
MKLEASFRQIAYYDADNSISSEHECTLVWAIKMQRISASSLNYQQTPISAILNASSPWLLEESLQ